jgi:hypothetical protein
MGGGDDSVGVLVDVYIFTGGVFLGKDGGAALHVDLIVVPSGIFMDGLTVLGELFFFRDVAESFLMLLEFGIGIGDEIGLEGICGKNFFVYIISVRHLNSNFIINDIIRLKRLRLGVQ